MSCCSVVANKKTHFVRAYIFPPEYDFTGASPSLRIAASEGASVLLNINLTPTVNGSSASVLGNAITFTITPPDLQSLPDGSPLSEPWVGVMEADVTAPAGVISLIEKREITVEKGV